jgi:hypothetical protein
MADGFKLVSGKKTSRAIIPCSKHGCTGSCPLSVVLRSNKKDGVPAACLVCDRRYKVPAGTAAPPKKGSTQGGSAVQKELLALKKEIAELKSSKPAACGASPESELASTDNVPLPAEDRAAVKALQQQIQQLKDLAPELRNSLCEAKGGYEAFSASLEQQRQQIFAKHRGSMPLQMRKQKSQLFLESVQKRKDQAQIALDTLQKQQAELTEKIAQQQQTLADAETKLQAAKIEADTIAQAAALEGTAAAGSTVPTQPGAVSAITAQAVKGFFRSLPPTVTEHPEGIHAVEQVMALLDKLDSAATHVHAAQESSTGNRSPGTADAVTTMVDECEMEQEMADFEELFRPRDDEQPEVRTQRLTAAIRSKQTGAWTKFRKH